MSGLLFLGEVIAFALVIAWAFAADRPGRTGEQGLLGMKTAPRDPADAPARAGPQWKRAAEPGAGPQRPAGAPGPDKPRLSPKPWSASRDEAGAPHRQTSPTPGWRRTLVAPRRPGR